MKQIEIEVKTNKVDGEGNVIFQKDAQGNVVKDSKGKPVPEREEWKVAGVEFEKSDIQITLSPEAAKYVTPEGVLSMINRQCKTDTANASRRERTDGAPKRVAVDAVSGILVDLLMKQGLDRETAVKMAEEKLAEANRKK